MGNKLIRILQKNPKLSFCWQTFCRWIERHSSKRQGFRTCVSGTNVVLHVGLLHAGVVTDAAAEREHPLLLVHMERHVADKLGVELRLEVTHMAAGRRRERKRTRRWRESEGGGTVSFGVMWRPHKLVSLLSVGAFFWWGICLVDFKWFEKKWKKGLFCGFFFTMAVLWSGKLTMVVVVFSSLLQFSPYVVNEYWKVAHKWIYKQLVCRLSSRHM